MKDALMYHNMCGACEKIILGEEQNRFDETKRNNMG